MITILMVDDHAIVRAGLRQLLADTPDLVVAGEATIRLRDILGTEIVEFPVRGGDYRIVEIPPGHTHSITNTGTSEMITLFWASEPFDPDRPDTYYLAVDPA